MENFEVIKWYNKKPATYLLLFFLYPIGIFLFLSNHIITRAEKIVYGTIATILFFVLAGPLLPEKEGKTSNSEPLNTVSTSKVDTSVSAQINRELIALKTLDFSQYYKDQTSLFISVALFKSWNSLIKEGSNSSDKKERKLASELKSKVQKLQKVEFPKLRLAYKKNIEHDLWLQNIVVKISGNKNQTLSFVGGTFASNKNKQDAMDLIQEIVTNLRFKSVTFKWIEHDDEYVSYKIPSESDESLD